MPCPSMTSAWVSKTSPIGVPGLSLASQASSSVLGGFRHGALMRGRAADDEGAHQAGVVLAIDAGEFQGELVLRIQHAPAGFVAAEQRIRPGADDEGIAGIIAAALEDSALHRGQDVALVRAGMGGCDGGLERVVGEFGGAPDISELGVRLHQAKLRDEVGGVRGRGEAVQRRIHLLALRGGEPVALIFDAEALAFEPAPSEQILQIIGGGRVVPIDPDANVLDDRGVLRLAQIGCSRQQHDLAIGAQHQALKKAVAEGVVAGQPVHALLLEHEESIEPALGHGRQRLFPSRVEFIPTEMQCHAPSLSSAQARSPSVGR